MLEIVFVLTKEIATLLEEKKPGAQIFKMLNGMQNWHFSQTKHLIRLILILREANQLNNELYQYAFETKLKLLEKQITEETFALSNVKHKLTNWKKTIISNQQNKFSTRPETTILNNINW